MTLSTLSKPFERSSSRGSLQAATLSMDEAIHHALGETPLRKELEKCSEEALLILANQREEELQKEGASLEVIEDIYSKISRMIPSDLDRELRRRRAHEECLKYSERKADGGPENQEEFEARKRKMSQSGQSTQMQEAKQEQSSVSEVSLAATAARIVDGIYQVLAMKSQGKSS